MKTAGSVGDRPERLDGYFQDSVLTAAGASRAHPRRRLQQLTLLSHQGSLRSVRDIQFHQDIAHM